MAGSITLTTDGGTAANPLSLSIDAGGLTIAGQTGSFLVSVNVGNGSLSLAGQTVDIATAEPLFSDGFDYTVPRDTQSEPTVFTAHGWASAMKATNIDNDNGDGRGYIYTTTTTPTGSGRALALESRPDLAPNVLGERQTDYYLTYGSASEGDTETIPGNVWLQWWTYGVAGSRYFGEDKFMYPTYATTHETSSLHWMILQGKNGFGQVGGLSPVAEGARRYCVQAADANNAAADTGAGFPVWKLWQNLDGSACLEGVWYQIKMHFDTSGTQGTWEMWRRQYGTAEWTKLAEWIGGVTTVPHYDTEEPITFNWIIGSATSAEPSGHTAMKMPTVVVCPDSDPYSSTTYMDDFAIYASDPG